MDGRNPPEMDIKVSIPAPTFYLQFEKRYSLNGKSKIYFLSNKSKMKKIENA